MKTEQQIERRIKRIKPRHDFLNDPGNYPKGFTLNNSHLLELYRLSGELKSLNWVLEKRKN